jgi:predicted LPLAT superfamily acyltransferase
MAKGFGQPTSKGKTGRQFFERLWDASEAGNREQVYRLLEENADKLTDNFARLVREDAELKLRRANPRQRGKLTAKLWKFSGFIDEFPRGNRASHIEIAIACRQVLTEFFPRHAFSETWAALQDSLGSCYGNRIRGDRAENLKVAISYHEAALQIYTREALPKIGH